MRNPQIFRDEKSVSKNARLCIERFFASNFDFENIICENSFKKVRFQRLKVVQMPTKEFEKPRDFFSWIWLYFKSLNRPLFHLGNIPRCFILLGISYSYRSVNSEGVALVKASNFHVQKFLHWVLISIILGIIKKWKILKIKFQKQQSFSIDFTNLKSYH